MKITEALLAEHLVFHNLFDHLEARLPGLKKLAEIQLLAEMMECLLSAHSATEDKLFIGPLDHCFEQLGQRETFHKEHVEIDANLKRVRNAKTVHEARELLLSAINYSRRHFDREERVVFPIAEKVLKSKTLSDLGKSWLDQRNKVLV
jgi:hemerythrin-like domain-containing protein